MDLEMAAMTIISYSGDARTQAFRSLALAREGKNDEAKELLNNAKEVSIKAHKAQTELLIEEANGGKLDINILLIHAQDHLMTSMLALELIQEMLYLYETK